MSDTTSWVIVRTATGKVIAETFSRRIVAAINQDKYTAVPIQDYLGRLNATIRNAGAIADDPGYFPEDE